MTQGQPQWPNGNPSAALTARDLVAIAFRHRRVTILCLSGVLLGAVLAAICLPKYEAESKILVQKRERADPIVSAEQKDPVTETDTLTEEELNSNPHNSFVIAITLRVETPCRYISAIASVRAFSDRCPFSRQLG